MAHFVYFSLAKELRRKMEKNRRNFLKLAGLSGGGMRSVFLGGYDERVKCAVPVGFMTTWKDLILDKATSHTWMIYVPLLPKELDFPEILGLRVPWQPDKVMAKHAQ